MDLGPGTPLIFVGPDYDNNPSGLTIGALYFVLEVRTQLICMMAAVSLRGNPGVSEWYCSCAFKPIGEPDGSLEKEKELEYDDA